VVWLLSASTNVLVRLAGVDPEADRRALGAEEVRDVIASAAALRPEQRRMIAGAFESSVLTVRDVLVPRREILALAVDAAASDAVTTLREAGHVRAPVIREDLDHVVGTVHVLELIGQSGTVGDHMRETKVFPEFVRVVDALREMQAGRLQMAMVSDEHGGIDGLVTVEDLVEEIVGEIFDEFDPKVTAVRPEADGSLVVGGAFPLHDLDELGVRLDVAGPFTTVGGLVMDRLGRVPEAGARVTEGEWEFEVMSMRGLAVRTARLRRVVEK
jgi:putative hemolysin